MANGIVELLMLLKKLLQKNYHLRKSCLQQLYLNKMMTQLLHLVFVFTPAANLVTDKFSCQSDELNSQRDEFICQQDEFICQRDEVNCQKDKFNCQNLYIMQLEPSLKVICAKQYQRGIKVINY